MVIVGRLKGQYERMIEEEIAKDYDLGQIAKRYRDLCLCWGRRGRSGGRGDAETLKEGQAASRLY